MLKQMFRFTSLLAIFLMAGAVSFSFAQSQKGGLNGTVKDTQGGVVVGATVEATNKATAEKSTAITNDSGNYTFPLTKEELCKAAGISEDALEVDVDYIWCGLAPVP